MIFYRLDLNGAVSYGEGYLLPDGAEELSEQDYTNALEVAKSTPVELPSVTVLYPVDLWSRLTDEEADEVEMAMSRQSARVQNIFRSASSYRSDHSLWELLETTATTLFGEERAAEILAPSNR
jgi:hypothetical protein